MSDTPSLHAPCLSPPRMEALSVLGDLTVHSQTRPNETTFTCRSDVTVLLASCPCRVQKVHEEKKSNGTLAHLGGMSLRAGTAPSSLAAPCRS